MLNFINEICNKSLLTRFIKNIFNYENLCDYNYMFRILDRNNELIIDIYDNVSDSKFNSYIFNFNECDYGYKNEMIEKLNIHSISILNIKDSDINLIKFAYLFNLDVDEMVEYAKTFLDKEFVLILKDIIK